MAPSGADESTMRADALMVRRGLAASRDRAQALIAEGGVLVDGMPLAKPAKKNKPNRLSGIAAFFKKT